MNGRSLNQWGPSGLVARAKEKQWINRRTKVVVLSDGGAKRVDHAYVLTCLDMTL